MCRWSRRRSAVGFGLLTAAVLPTGSNPSGAQGTRRRALMGRFSKDAQLFCRLRPSRRGAVGGREAGTAAVEFALTGLLLFGMLLVVFDFGLYAYAFISVENAARVAALRNSSGVDSAADQSIACAMALEEVRGLPNIGSSFQSTCSEPPLVVSSVLCNNSIPCANAAPSADGQAAVSVSITYSMPSVFRAPFVGPVVITRTAQMKIQNLQ